MMREVLQSPESVIPHLHTWLDSQHAEPPLLLSGIGNSSQQKLIQLLHGNAVQNIDYFVIAPDPRSIKVKQIRELREHLFSTSFKKHRLIIFREIDRILVAAANMMLKELEEPSKTNRFLLLTAFPRQVLATIRSRCYHIRFLDNDLHQPSDIQTLGELLTHVSPHSLSEEHISLVSGWFTEHPEIVSSTSATSSVYMTLLRLRDYYKIKSLGGNDRLASDALLASINQLRNTIK